MKDLIDVSEFTEPVTVPEGLDTHDTLAEFIEAIVSGKSGFTAIELEGQTVNVVDKMAIVRHMFHGTQRKSGEKVKLFNLTVWLQQQDQWKLVARQAAKLA